MSILQSIIILPFGETVDVLDLKEKIDANKGSVALYNLTGKKVPSQEKLNVLVVDQPVHSPINKEDLKSCFMSNYDPGACMAIMNMIAKGPLKILGFEITKKTKVEFHSIQSKGNETQRVLFAKVCN